jgi:iron complex outermembrane receptor protein
MGLRRSWLVGSASVLAVAAACVPAYAAAADNDSTSVKEVVVTGIRGSLQNSLGVKRRADGVVDAVSAEDIGKLPDKNVADALQRIPGVNTVSAASGEGGFDENDRVSIRGTNPSLAQTTINGHSVANGDWFILDQFQTVGRSVSYTLMPSEMVAATLVYKSQQADLVEGGVAGSIDMITRKPLDLKQPITMQAYAGGAYADLPSKTDPQLNGLIGWKNDDGTFGVIAQAFYEKRNVRRDGQEFLGYQRVTCDEQNPAFPGVNCRNQTWINVPALRNKLYPSLIGSALFTQERIRKGGDLTVQWRPSDQFELSVDGFYSKLDAENFNQNVMAWVSHEIHDNVPTSWTLNGDTIVKAAFPLVGPTGPVMGYVADYITRPKASGSTYYVNFDGTWRPTADWTIKGKAGFTRGEGLTPTQPAFEANAFTGMTYDMSHGVAAVSFPDIDPSDPTGMFNGWAWNNHFTAIDKETYVQGDAEYKWDHGPFRAIKFGARYADHSRDVQGFNHGCAIGADGHCWTAGAYPMSGVANGTYPSDFASEFRLPGFLTQPVAGDFNAIGDLVNPITPFQAPWYYWPGSFKLEEKDAAVYGMAKVGGDGWHGNFGLRVVDTKLTSFVNTSPGPIVSSLFGSFGITKVEHDYVDFLPSASLAFDLRDDVILRVSAARTMARPDYSALGGAVSLTDLNLTGSGGNPDLKPIRSSNYDASLEWYFAPQSLLSVGVFYMDLSSYVDSGVSPHVYHSMLSGHDETYQITSPVNTSGENKGVEVNWQQPLAWGFGIASNVTWADGKTADGGALQGNSKLTYNVVGYYENEKLSARLAYTYRSHFLVGLDRSTAENQDSIGNLAASVNYKVTPNVTLNVDGLNLTNETLKYYGDTRVQPRAFYSNGRQIYFGVRMSY